MSNHINSSYKKKDYSYKADDESLLTPPLYKYLVDPLLLILPKSIPANLITIVSNSFVSIAFVVALCSYLNNNHKLWWSLPLLMLIYITGDASDGKQARRTGTCSPLGEFMDHFLDTFVSGQIIGIVVFSWKITNPIAIILCFVSLYFAQASSFWERLKTGIMHFGKLSSSEGLLAFSTLAALSGIDPIRNFLNQEAFSIMTINFSFIDLIILISTSAPLITSFISLTHIGNDSFYLFIYLVLSAFVIITTFKFTSIFLFLFISTLYNVYFISTVLVSTNIKTFSPHTSYFVPILCLLSYFINNNKVSFYIWLSVSIFLLFMVIRTFLYFFMQNKKYWLWKNPIIHTENTTNVH